MYTVQGNSGYWAPFRISQNLPKHSTATRAVTWSLTTSAVCGDPQTSGMGTVLKWVVPVTLQYLFPLTVGALVGGYREVETPLSSLLDGPGLVDWHCSIHFLRGKQWTVPSRTDGALSLQLWYCSSFNQPDYSAIHWIQSLLVFLFFPLNFHPVLLISCESANVCVCVSACVFVCERESVVQSKYCTSCWQERGRQTNVQIHWHMNTPPTHTHTHVTGLNHCTVCGTELYASHKTSAGFSLHLQYVLIHSTMYS